MEPLQNFVLIVSAIAAVLCLVWAGGFFLANLLRLTLLPVRGAPRRKLLRLEEACFTKLIRTAPLVVIGLAVLSQLNT